MPHPRAQPARSDNRGQHQRRIEAESRRPSQHTLDRNPIPQTLEPKQSRKTEPQPIFRLKSGSREPSPRVAHDSTFEPPQSGATAEAHLAEGKKFVEVHGWFENNVRLWDIR